MIEFLVSGRIQCSSGQPVANRNGWFRREKAGVYYGSHQQTRYHRPSYPTTRQAGQTVICGAAYT